MKRGGTVCSTQMGNSEFGIGNESMKSGRELLLKTVNILSLIRGATLSPVPAFMIEKEKRKPVGRSDGSPRIRTIGDLGWGDAFLRMPFASRENWKSGTFIFSPTTTEHLP